MVLQAITFFMQVLTAIFYNIESWTISTGGMVGFNILSLIIWYLCIGVVFTLLVRLLGGAITTHKENKNG